VHLQVVSGLAYKPACELDLVLSGEENQDVALGLSVVDIDSDGGRLDDDVGCGVIVVDIADVDRESLARDLN
jgi:hypothetical protein